MAAPLGPANVLGELRWNLDGFNAKLDAYAKALHLGIADAVKTTAFRLEAMIKSRTPVDTGRARNSWHTAVWGGPVAHVYQDRHGRSFDGSFADAPKSPLEAVVGTNISYGLALEAGWSKKAPQGMVRISVAEMRQQFVAAVLAAKAKSV